MDKLLKFATSLQDGSGEGAASAQPAAPSDRRPIDTGVIDHIMGKDDATHMKEAMAAITHPDQPLDQKEIAFDNLELLVEHVDNAINLASLGLWPPLVAQLEAPEAPMRRMAAWVVGTAVQNNPQVQSDFLATGEKGLAKLVSMVASDPDAQVRAKCVYAVSCTLRHNPLAVAQLSQLDQGWPALLGLVSVNTHDISTLKRVVFMMGNLLREDDANTRKLVAAAVEEQHLPARLVEIINNSDMRDNEDLMDKCIVTLATVLESGATVDPTQRHEATDSLEIIAKKHPEIEDKTSQLRSQLMFDSVDDTVKAIKAGELVIVMDDEGRENEGDFIMAAELATPEKMAFLVRYSSGYVCVPCAPEVLDRLRLPPMVEMLEDEMKTAYAVTCDYRAGVTTGISASDRCNTARRLANPEAVASDFNRPGHMIPLRYHEGGVLKRRGHTEASVDLCKLAQCQPVAVICEICNDDGTMMRRDAAVSFARTHGLKICTIEKLVKHIEAL